VLERHFAVAWNDALQSQDAAKIEAVLQSLPATISLAEVQVQFPALFQQCQLAFPALVQERSKHPLQLRSRALHHCGEVKRVATAVKLLREDRDSNATMRALGTLLNASHASLRDLYDVSTTQVIQLYEIITSDAQVLGARLIGGGFGGNVLALTTAANVAALLHRAQREFYAPQQRDGLGEGAIMISTPGAGLSELI
jgi:galactokinase